MRFFVEPGAVKADTIEITAADAWHIAKVLRMRPGDLLNITALGHNYETVILSLSPNQVVCQITACSSANWEPELKVFLLQGLAKGEKMEWILQKAVEIGVTEFWPVACNRSVVQLNDIKAGKKTERWQTIAKAAAQQCGRSTVPKVQPVQDLAQAIKALPPEILLVTAWEEATAQGLKQLLQNQAPQPIALLIGPEGGLSAAEIALCQARQAAVVSLGPRILRTETAAIAALTCIMYQWADFGGTSE